MEDKSTHSKREFHFHDKVTYIERQDITVQSGATFYNGPAKDTKVEQSSEIKTYLDKLLPFIKNSRCWFGVAKALMEKGYVAEGDFDGACTLIETEYENNAKPKTNARDLKSMYAGSLRKNICEWDANNQDLGDAFPNHLTIAKQAMLTIPQP